MKAFTGNKSASGRVPDPESFLIGRLKFVNHTNTSTQTLIIWLCSDQASFMTGANIPVDGGYVAQ